MRIGIVLAIAVGVGTAALAVLLLQPSSGSAPAAVDGAKAYIRHGCQSCHGAQGEGRMNLGPALVGSPLRGDAGAFAARIRAGAPASPAWRMPMGAFTGSPAELEAIIRHIQHGLGPSASAAAVP